MLKCKVLSGDSISALETAVNDWLAVESDNITIEYINSTEGSVVSAAFKVFIFYTNDWARTPQV
jgi:hypothetical protein